MLLGKTVVAKEALPTTTSTWPSDTRKPFHSQPWLSSSHASSNDLVFSSGSSQLMAFSLGSTPVVVASDPHTAHEILTSPHFADRPVNQSAKSLMFSRAIGFAPNGTYWRLLRRIASSQHFSPRRILAHKGGRQLDCAVMLRNIASEQELKGSVVLRNHLQSASLNSTMGSGIIEEHRRNGSEKNMLDCGDFVNVLLSLDGKEKLNEDDMVAVLWEMIFRGTDTTALLTEWVMPELILNSELQSKLQAEIDSLVGKNDVTDADVARLHYLQAIVKETFRLHPPGPLLWWARLSMSDVQLSNGMLIPANTTTMVNMWAITHDSQVWFGLVEAVSRFGG
ncbi:Cytochrome P450 [Dillenia turbinata]|uniref:Cytochrome P450 n=1 Tax=Dillenia turbinata TaxID=194707 RepID=A0AAN8Z338_9MAGN